MDEPKFIAGQMYVPENRTYSDSMRYDSDIVNNFLDIILPFAEKACESMQDGAAVIAEYCAADGKISLTLIQKIIGLIRRYDRQREVMVVYEDYIGNDYNALFRHVLQGLSSQDTLLTSGVHIMASSTTMYKQCLLSNSVQFIFSFQGLYYLSRKPCKVTSSILPVFAKPEERLLYEKQAENDWKLFLSLRSRELKPGGLMFIIPSCRKEQEIYFQLDIVLKSLLKDRIITEDEFSDIHINAYMRSMEEFRKPFQEDADEVKDLELVYLDVAEHVIFRVESGSLGREKATTLMEIARTFTYNPIIENLSKDRTITEKEKIVNEFFNRYVEIFQQFTTDVHVDHFRMIIRKK